MELKNIRLYFKKWHDKTNKDFDDFTLEENILHEFDELINDRDKARKEKSQLNIENAFVIQDRNKAVRAIDLFINGNKSKTMGYYSDDQIEAIDLMREFLKTNSPDNE